MSFEPSTKPRVVSMDGPLGDWLPGVAFGPATLDIGCDNKLNIDLSTGLSVADVSDDCEEIAGGDVEIPSSLSSAELSLVIDAFTDLTPSDLTWLEVVELDGATFCLMDDPLSSPGVRDFRS